MPIIASELKFYKSTNGLGGAITANDITSNVIHNVFDTVTSDEALLGDVEYRCIYLKNTNASITLENAIVFLASNTPLATTNMEIGLGTVSIGSTEQAVADESTAPIGVTFTDLIGEANKLTIGNIAAGSYKAIWLKRTINSGSLASNGDGITITVSGDTGA